MPDFLPRRDADLLAWSTAFDSNIHSDPESFGLSAGMAAEYRTLHLAFAEAYRAAVSPGERTAGTIRSKVDCRASLTAKARELARIVKANPAVTRTQWITLGLRGEQGGRRIARPTPAGRPMVSVAQLGGARLRVTLRDPASSSRSAKPAGVGWAMLQYAEGQTPPANPGAWRRLELTTRTTVDVTIPGMLPAGTRIWIIAQWTNGTGQRGPASDPILTWIAGEVPMVA